MTHARRITFPERHAERRAALLKATYDCFLQIGFARTSVDKIAAQLNIARPLVYLLFPDKDALFREAMRSEFASYIEAGRLVANSELEIREKLVKMYEVMIIRPWHRISTAPAADEFHEHCYRLFPEVETEADKQILALLVQIFGDKNFAKVFKLAVDGQRNDMPSAAILRRRTSMVINYFLDALQLTKNRRRFVSAAVRTPISARPSRSI